VVHVAAFRHPAFHRVNDQVGWNSVMMFIA